MITAKRCPFCNGQRLQIERSPATAWVHCLECDATGPNGATDLLALTHWNYGHNQDALVANPARANRNDRAPIAT